MAISRKKIQRVFLYVTKFNQVYLKDQKVIGNTLRKCSQYATLPIRAQKIRLTI